MCICWTTILCQAIIIAFVFCRKLTQTHTKNNTVAHGHSMIGGRENQVNNYRKTSQLVTKCSTETWRVMTIKLCGQGSLWGGHDLLKWVFIRRNKMKRNEGHLKKRKQPAAMGTLCQRRRRARWVPSRLRNHISTSGLIPASQMPPEW